MASIRDLVLSMFLALLGVAIIFIAFTIPTGMVRDAVGPRGFPIVMGTILALGGAFLCIQRLRRWRQGDGRNDPDLRAIQAAIEEKSYALPVIAITVGFTALLNPLGYLIATPLALAALMVVLGFRKVWVIASTAALFTGITFVTFSTLLRVRLPIGPLQFLF